MEIRVCDVSICARYMSADGSSWLKRELIQIPLSSKSESESAAAAAAAAVLLLCQSTCCELTLALECKRGRKEVRIEEEQSSRFHSRLENDRVILWFG